VVYNISHWKDLDGIASAAIIHRYCLLNNIPVQHMLASPHNVHEKLRNLNKKCKGRNAYLYITDIGLDEDIASDVVGYLKELKSRSWRIYWFDHHVWDYDVEAKVSSIVDRLVIDRSKCAAEICYEQVLPEDEIAKRLAELARDMDFWIKREELSVKLSKVLSTGYDRYKLISILARGIFWNNELEKTYRKAVEREEKLLKKALSKVQIVKVDNLKVAIVKSNIPAGLIADILAKEGVDIIAVVSCRGTVSLRRGNKSINLLPIAKKLHGGGHPYAAGGNLGYNIFDKFLARLGFYRKLNLIVNAVKASLNEIMED